MKYSKDTHAIALLSGGLGSFLSTYLYKQQNPGKTVIGYFTDVKNEDLDTYRFLVESAEWLGIELIRDADGRDIWQAFEDRRYVGNTRSPVCSLVLKIEQRVNWLKENCEQGIDVVIGFDWSEIHRVEKARSHEAFANLVAPLIDDLRDKTEIYETLKSPPQLPELYSMGFPHANCGGCCVQAGLAQWALVWQQFPERYTYHELRQEDVMARNPGLRPFLRQTRQGQQYYLTLKEWRLQLETKERKKPFQQELDFGGCGCAFEY